MFRYLLAAWGAVLLASASAPAEAARVSPMIVDLEPTGRESVGRVELSNTGAGDFPVEVRMFRGEISEDGQLELTPADENFLVFPAQIIVPANSQQAFRVQYVGEPELAKSEIYYMQVRQVPVDVSPGTSQVQVVVNYNVLVNVVPDKASPMPEIASIEPVMRGDQPGIEVRVVNRGTRYFTAGTRAWQVRGRTQDGGEMAADLKPEEMARLIGVGVVAPDRARSFFVPTERLLTKDTAQVVLGS